MPTVIIIIVLVLIAIFTIKNYAQKLSSGCCGAGGDKEKKIAPKDNNPTSYPYISDVKIEGMHCKKCAIRIENAFNKRDGFYAVVDLKNNNAKIHTKELLSDYEIRRTIIGMDYKVIDITHIDNELY